MGCSCASTLFTQIILCSALFIAFYMPNPQKLNNQFHMELYFISVSGGYRPPSYQIHLLKQMEKVAKIYKAKFIVNISERGDDDPLFQNVTVDFPSLNVPWYITSAYQGQENGYFLKQIKAPHEQILDIIAIDTSILQDSLHVDQINDVGGGQLQWLKRTLAMTNSNWRIVVGFHPLVICEQQKTARMPFYEPLNPLFLKYGVNAYLSKHSSASYYIRDGGIAHIGNPVFTDETHTDPLINRSSSCIRGMQNGFLLHRITPLEIASYFINSASKIVFKSTLQQWGKAAM